jgi:uroporphyrinogen decarboxylase
MNSKSSIYRDRFKLTLEHKPVDRCPIDLGGTPQSTIESPETAKLLAEYLGFIGEPPSDYDKLDRRILEHFDIDFRRVGNMVWFNNHRNYKISDTEFSDCYGLKYRFSGIYWEIVDGPLRNATVDDLRTYEFPKIEQMEGSMDDWAARAKTLYEESPYVIVGEHPVMGVLELACWLCGYEYIMMMLALDPDLIHMFFGRILEFQKGIIKDYYERMGPYIHLTTSGDDFGTQAASFMSREMWCEFVKPYMKERINYTHQFTDAVYMHHTCGAVYNIIPDLIEIGVKILNPIQPHAAGMEPSRLKTSYGDQIVFHGGLDTQVVLPSNDPVVIDEAVEHLLKVMNVKASSGYVFAPAHNLQIDVSAEAIARMYSTALKTMQ